LFNWFQRPVRYLLHGLEAGFNTCFGDRWNPLYYLGSLAFFFFWVVAISGLYLYIFFETSITGAYASIESLTVEQWYLGGVMRSLHRYASDAMVVTMALHMLREFVMDRYRGVRWFSWLTGVPLIWLVYASGIGGYWLVWDELAQYIATMTAEWLDWLPLFDEPMSRNFLNQSTLSDRFFSLLAFLHIGIPLTLLMVMWIHVQRLGNPRTNPPRILIIGSLLALLVLSLVWPAVSQPPANLDLAVGTVSLDWYFLFVFPLLDAWSPATVWLFAAAFTVYSPFCHGCRPCNCVHRQPSICQPATVVSAVLMIAPMAPSPCKIAVTVCHSARKQWSRPACASVAGYVWRRVLQQRRSAVPPNWCRVSTCLNIRYTDCASASTR